jgi:hypothetical protein
MIMGAEHFVTEAAAAGLARWQRGKRNASWLRTLAASDRPVDRRSHCRWRIAVDVGTLPSAVAVIEDDVLV